MVQTGARVETQPFPACRIFGVCLPPLFYFPHPVNALFLFLFFFKKAFVFYRIIKNYIFNKNTLKVNFFLRKEDKAVWGTCLVQYFVCRPPFFLCADFRLQNPDRIRSNNCNIYATRIRPWSLHFCKLCHPNLNLADRCHLRSMPLSTTTSMSSQTPSPFIPPAFFRFKRAPFSLEFGMSRAHSALCQGEIPASPLPGPVIP